jgi:hypothetical protein
MSIVARVSSDSALDCLASSADLLPAGDALAPVRHPAPLWALGQDVRRLADAIADPIGCPAAWTTTTFARDVERIRTHLGPVRSRAALASSFVREACHRITQPDEDTARPYGRRQGDDPAAVGIAYAIRWLELGDSRPRPRWRDWLTSTVQTTD